MAQYEAKYQEQTLSENSFIHGSTAHYPMYMELLSTKNRLKDPFGTQFEGITINTAANRKSLMYEKTVPRI